MFRPEARSANELLQTQVKLKKADHSDVPRYRLKNREYATAELVEKFMAPSHAMLSAAAAEAEGIRNDTLEEFRVKTTEETSALKTRVVEYNMWELFLLPEIIDEGSGAGEADAAPTFGTREKVDLLAHHSTVTLDECKQWTMIISIHGTIEVQESNMWLKELLVNSSTGTPHRKVCETHDKLPVK